MIPTFLSYLLAIISAGLFVLSCVYADGFAYRKEKWMSRLCGGFAVMFVFAFWLFILNPK